MTSEYTIDAERFWAMADKSGDCWLWMGTIRGLGYGQFRVNGQPYYAHRVAFGLAYGYEPAEVCHKCDINYPPGDLTYRRCVRPEHLFGGTHSDNMKDAYSKGRARGCIKYGGMGAMDRGTVECPECHIVREVGRGMYNMVIQGKYSGRCQQCGAMARWRNWRNTH